MNSQKEIPLVAQIPIFNFPSPSKSTDNKCSSEEEFRDYTAVEITDEENNNNGSPARKTRVSINK